ncbi:hypothetical protein DPMN_018051 [Dreissena polymorpha]|uniref:Uncharacterized protein n=1 Tax=Dreissena polymorpha TaxID=45954 RepID=A0A9D4NI19_DREPO|nr:hypothetical protein DPMN_018051 [Dreissena polymorpha]
MSPQQLVDVAKGAFQSEDAVDEEDEDKEASPKAVGHNIFILAKQLSQHNKDLAALLKPCGDLYGDQALEFYAKHTAQIEVCQTQGTDRGKLTCMETRHSSSMPNTRHR